MVRATRAAAVVLAALLCVATPALLRDASESIRAGGIAYYNPAAATGATSIIVRVRGAGDLDAVAASVTRRGYTIIERAADPPALAVVPPTGASIEHAVNALASASGVAYAEPSYPLSVSDVPAAPLYTQQAAYLEAVHAPEAWDIEKGEPTVVVAILDTGVDITHRDLQGRIWTNIDEIPANSVDDDGNGCVDDVHGCAFVVEPTSGCGEPADGDIHDDLGHGTFVSGVVAANGETGIVGVARGATVMPVKVLDCKGVGNSFALAQGILYAVQNGASVLNVSLGAPVEPEYLHEAIRIANDEYGVLLVAATGNTGGDVAFPARYPEVLAVGAESASHPGQHASFSGAGPEVDVVAVGQGILGTMPDGACSALLVCLEGDNTHAIGYGTSFAAPQVTGLVALMLSRNRYLTPHQIVSVIKATADPIVGGGPADWAGAGRINMQRALIPQYRIGVPGSTRG